MRVDRFRASRRRHHNLDGACLPELSWRMSRLVTAGTLLAAVLGLAAGPQAEARGGGEPAAAQEGEWRIFRGGPQLRGIASSELPAELSPLWIFKAGDSIESSAAIAGGMVYVGSLDGFLYAVDLESGKLRWKYQAALEIKSSPSVFGGTVYFGDESGDFYALDALTGEEKWIFSTGAEIISSANLADGSLVFGSYDNYIYCLSAEDGSLKWKVETYGYVNGTPALVDDKVVSVGCDGFCRVLRLEDGKLLSSVEVYAYVGASPAVIDGKAYFGTFENQMLAIDLSSSKVLWEYEHPMRKFPYYSSAAVTADRLVVGGRDKMLHALDSRSGDSLWTFRTRARIDSSPVIVGDRVFFGAGSGEVFALDLSTGKELWRFETGSSIAASPSVAAGRLVIGTEDGDLYCFG
ncbi:MAG: PQQ-binding-like beta-propeller repeat protein [Acidobacteriota bacterium]